MTALLTPLVILLVGLRWWLRWSLIVPVTVLEKTGLRATLRRSKELTKGRRLGIFGIYILIILLGIVVAWLIQTPLLLVTGFRSLRDPYHVNTGAQVASFVGQFVSSSLVGGLATIALTLIYYDQRVRKEGFDLQLMMAALQPESRPPAAAATASN
jgi:membrane-anchored glycerophosphoryl diester phosphodiesterase (GDPDase)